MTNIYIALGELPIQSNFLEVPFETLKGKAFTKITHHQDSSDDFYSNWNLEEMERIEFIAEDGTRFLLSYEMDIGNEVYIESIVGDLSDLVGMEILMAEESVSEDGDEGAIPPVDDLDPENEYDNSYTWTFYKLASAKGYVDIRFFGKSNGYYAEKAQLYQVQEK